MEGLRKSLEKLGWPIGEMSDKQITRELYRRWFACQTDDMDEEAPLSVASARGIFTSMAAEGNLDALCWSDDNEVPAEEVVEEEEQSLFTRPEQPRDESQPERRRGARESARELVYWSDVSSPWLEATGWLIDRSTHGIAFIVQTQHAPQIGEEIIPSVHTREQGVIKAGQATVVRTDQLNPGLVLICAELAEPQDWSVSSPTT